jgi:hypothetical protein
MIFSRLSKVFLVGVLLSLVVHLPFIPNKENPLYPKESIWDRVISWRYTQVLRECLRLEGELPRFQCVNEALRVLSQQHGARLALNVIEPLAQGNAFLLGYGHDLSHTIGNNAVYASYGAQKAMLATDETALIEKIGKVLVDCDGWGSFGCYHGVIEVSLSRIESAQRTRVIRKACLENPLVNSKQFYLNQCMHWFGHSMAIFTDQTLEETLAMCEGVSSNYQSDEVQLCLSGVFHAGAMPGTSDSEYLGNIGRVYSRDDVYFPCEQVEERFRGHCYSHVVGRSHTGDVGVIMRNCEGIPEPNWEKRRTYIRGCYESMGNNLLINGNFTADGVAKQCDELGNPAYAGFCYGGAARYDILRDPLINNDLPFEICTLAPPSAKDSCYALIGFANFENYKSNDVLTAFCARSEEGYEKSCASLSP